MQDQSPSARNTGTQKRSTLGLTPVPLDRQTSPHQSRPHHPLVSNRRADLSGALRDEIHELRNRSHDAEIAKTAILANLSHEFRTPLNAIIGFSELLLSDATGKLENEQHRDYIDDIHKSAFRLLDMVNVLLDTADVTNGLADLQLDDGDLVDVFSQARQGLKSAAQARKLDLEIDADAPSCTFRIDRQRFSQAARQILAQAIRQAQPGGTILVRLHNGDHAVSISLSYLPRREVPRPGPDNPDDRHYISHSADSAGESGGGIDLDLSMAQTIIELHGGILDLTGNASGGLAAEIYLPRQTA